MSEYTDLVKLAELLRPPEDDNENEEDEIPTVHPFSCINLNKNESKEKLENDSHTKDDKANDGCENWDPDEMARKYMEKECPQESSDWRKAPHWDVTYRQKVTPSDVFLQMGGKTPATASCEEMILTVHLPGESRHNVDLKITKENLKLTSPHFKLDIPLPHPVDPQKGNAQFDSDAEKLIITLVLDREFDFINF